MRTLLLCLTFGAATLFAQTIQVSGRVLTVAGQPIPDASVSWRQVGLAVPPTDPAAEAPFVTTNAEGSFTLSPSAPGQYRLDVTKPGWIPQHTSYTLKEGQTLGDLSFRLVPASSITGRVLDSEGKPVPKALVTAFRYAFIRGARSLSAATYLIAADENGVYTIPNLTAGRYYVRVEAAGPAVATYYPSTLDLAAAAAIDVETAATRSGVDIRQRNEPLFHVHGRVVDESGAPAAHVPLRILPEHPVESMSAPAPFIYSVADGSFEFKDLLPGRYVIRAVPDRYAVIGAGRIDVAITRGSIDDLVLKVNAGYALAGKLKTEDDSPLQIPPAGLRVYLTDAEQSFGVGGLDASVAREGGVFRIDKIPPAKYYIAVGPLVANVYIKSVRYGGQDITRSPIDLIYGGGDNLEIVLGVEAGRVDAVVRNSKGEAVPGALAALWPDQPDAGNPNGSVRVLSSGDYGAAILFHGVRPGKYHLVAFDGVEQAFVQSPDFLDRFKARATELAVGDGGYVSRSLEPISREDSEAVIRNLP